MPHQSEWDGIGLDGPLDDANKMAFMLKYDVVFLVCQIPYDFHVYPF